MITITAISDVSSFKCESAVMKRRLLHVVVNVDFEFDVMLFYTLCSNRFKYLRAHSAFSVNVRLYPILFD